MNHDASKDKKVKSPLNQNSCAMTHLKIPTPYSIITHLYCVCINFFLLGHLPSPAHGLVY